MTRDKSEWLRDDERLSVDQYGRRSAAGSPPDYLGGQDGYGPQARHAGPADPYGPPDGYGPADGYGTQDRYRTPDSYGTQDRYRTPDSYGPQDRYGQPDPFGGPDGLAHSDRPHGDRPHGDRPHGDRRAGQDEGYGPRDPYAQPDPFGRPDPLTQRDRYGPPGSHGQQEPHDRPDRFGSHDGFGWRDPHAGRDDAYGPPDAVSQTDPFGGQNGSGRRDRDAALDNPYGRTDAFGQPAVPGPPAWNGEPDPGGAQGDYRQQDWRAGQDPLGSPAGYGQDLRARQDRHRPQDEDGPTDPRGMHGGPGVSGQPGSGGQQDPYPSPPRRHGPGGSAPEAPSSGPYRWRPPADLGTQDGGLQTGGIQESGERRTGDWRYPGQQPGVAGQPEWGQMSGEQGIWQEPVSHDAGWHEPVPDEPRWQEPARYGPAGYDPAGYDPARYDPAGYGPAGYGPAGQSPVRPDPGWQQPVSDQAGWQESGGDDPGWQNEEEPRSGILPGFSRGAGDGRGTGRRPRRRRIRWVAPLVSFIVILAALGGAGSYLFRRYEASHANYTGPGTGTVVVQVLPGDSATLLGPRLVRLGVIKATGPFTAAAKDSTSAVGLQPGYFRLRKHMNAALAYAALVDPQSRIQVVATIPEGLRDSRVASALSAKTGIAASQFTKVFRHPAALGLPAYAGGNPEGYLFPATYDIQPRATATGILQEMVQRFNQEAATINLAAAAKQAKISESHAIIVASLVQAEGGRLQDFPKIARVIYNRLANGMQLELDSTVMFAIDKYGIRATIAQTHVNSPYNTYLHAGLPPGPIDSPGDAAIKAALHPAAGNWRYFVTVDPKTGLTKFTNSQAQFREFVAELDRNLQNGT